MSEDRHPIEIGRIDLTPDERIRALESALAQLWDQVWWLSLPVEKREEYKKEGFDNPIEKYYGFCFQDDAKNRK